MTLGTVQPPRESANILNKDGLDVEPKIILQSACVALTGQVTKSRSLGKRLRFVDLQVSKAELDDTFFGRVSLPRGAINFSLEEGLSLEREAKCVPGSHIEASLRINDWVEGEVFPSHRREVRVGDTVRLCIAGREIAEGVNGNPDKSIFRACAWQRLDRPIQELKQTTWDQQLQAERRKPGTEPCGTELPSCDPLTKRRKTDSELLETKQHPPALCKHWLYSGECPTLKTCPFRHSGMNSQEENRIARLRHQREQVVGAQREEACAYGDGHPAGDVACKSARSSVFATWLLDTFGCDTLVHGSGVFDIAGGKGLNCIELLKLTKRSDLATVVIDPLQRNTQLAKRHKKLLRKHNLKVPEFQFKEFDEAYLEEPSALERFQKAGCVIGMHSDQATGSLVQLAVRHRRPFAVVPCCVFTKEFPDRRTPEGKTVETLNEFIAWLMSHHPNMQVDFLSIDGRNKVLFMRAEDYSREFGPQSSAHDTKA
mmetsp:Transcript_14274/g.25581  ORF Transcript_14274/g.25581 Transcript_14274/m.25581 type:complete len:485 (-) Transcript_14274:272-1726(-)|eukprot:CAMPEP_0184548924 /NCGR_PEP_ID=MMETSP0199_2-20130426/6500_1 /TAXON_ID=1112570 /ORGANISM="Thraustochytrium sp., Strain LLF1b" /LENGTH=484 /DNA_ID=CAMNT_0026943599 /DNA_START=105 /DNA_END=1559 /DNA_ORIENTATION=-